MPFARAAARFFIAIAIVSSVASPTRVIAAAINDAPMSDTTFVAAVIARIESGASNITAVLSDIPETIASLVTSATDALADRLGATSLTARTAPLPSPKSQAAAAAAPGNENGKLSSGGSPTGTTAPAASTGGGLANNNSAPTGPPASTASTGSGRSNTSPYVSPLTLATLLAQTRADILARLPNTAIAAPVPWSGGGAGVAPENYAGAFGLAQRIDQLTNTTITTPAISGGTISNSTLVSPSISGGTITGANISGSTLNVSADATAAYFTATSTTATSTFAGAIGIGTTTPWGLLSVNPDAIGSAVPEFVIGSSTATHFVVTGAGKVGIGTTSPFSMLHLYAGSSGGTSASGIFTLESNTSVYMQLLTTNTNDEQIRFGDSDNSASGLIRYHHNGDFMSFYTSGAERLRIDSTGNVGIGTTSPYAKLSVTGTAAATTTLALRPASGQTANILDIYNGSGSLTSVINSTGLVGIGTTTPWGLLSVNPNAIGSAVPEFVIGSSTATHFVVTGAGNVGMGTSSANLTGFTRALTIAVPVNSAALQFSGNASVVSSIGSITARNEAITLSQKRIGQINFGPQSTNPNDGGLINFLTNNNGTLAEAMRISNLGNVGIGTTSPFVALNVASTSASALPNGGWGQLALTDTNAAANKKHLLFSYIKGMFYVGTSTDLYATSSPALAIDSSGWTGIATSSPGSLFAVGNVLNIPSTGTSTLASALNVTGPIGIGTTSPDMLLSVGSNTPSGSVAHFENSTGSCYINPTTTSLSCSSDARLKTNINPLASSTLDELLKLEPVTYNWRTESATSSPHTGFIAQEVQGLFPDLVSQGPDGYLTLNYAGLTPYLVKAVQEIAAKLDVIATTVSNFAENFTSRHIVATQEMCVGATCVNERQLAAILAATGQSNSPIGSARTPPETSTSPNIQINGANPAIIHIGDIYADLGAMITGPQEDINLGIATWLNGVKVNSIRLDTSTISTTTIDYVVTDTFGQTATATRAVIVQPVAL